MNDDDEVIETSDVDERDALHTTDQVYWRQAVSDIRTRRPSHHSPSPRKRVKLDHDVNERVSSLSIHLEDDLKLSQSLVPSSCPSSPDNDLSNHSSSLVPTPQDHNDDDPQALEASDVPIEPYENSQDPLNMFMTHSSPLALTPSPSPSPPSPAPNSPANQEAQEAQNATLAHALHANPDTHADRPNRYSMRQRRPQQLHPYIHDQMLYKMQMRSNPEAIVKFRVRVGSPGARRSQSREGGGELGEGEEETQEGRMDVDGKADEEDGTWVDRRHNSPHAGPSNTNPIPTWLPSALRHPRTDSDEDEPDVRELLREARRVKERARRREREERERLEKERRDEGGKEEGKRKSVKRFPVRKERERGKGKEKANERDGERSPSSVSSLDIGILRPQPNTNTPHNSNPNSPAISIHSSPVRSLVRSPTADYDFNCDNEGDGGEYREVEDNSAWVGHADDGGMRFESPVQCHPQPSGSGSNPQRLGSSASHSHHSNSNPNNSIKSNSSSDLDSSSDEMTSKDRKRLKALQRMMPAAMARQLEKKAQQQKARATRQRSASTDRDGKGGGGSDVLVPGKTRVRIGLRKGDAEIKGDTESEDLDPPASAPDLRSDSDLDADIELVRHKKPKRAVVVSDHVTYISDSVVENGDEESSSDDDEVDDVKIGAWLGDRPWSGGTGTRRLREESLVDWMLTRTRTVGGQGKTKQPKKMKMKQKSMRRAGEPRAKSSGQSRLNIVTSGAHAERQTLLSFDKHNHSKRKTGGQHPHPATWSSVEDDVDVYNDPEPGVNRHWVEENDYSKSAAAAVMKKRKKKKQRGPPQVYVFTSKGKHITSGRRRPESGITIDVEDEGFHQALAPDGAHRPPARRKAKQPKQVGGHDNHDAAAMGMPMDFEVDYEPPPQRHELQTSFEHRRDIKVDFEIHFLLSGLAFQPHSYIGKGWLRELVTLVSGSDTIVVPNPYAAHDIELGPATSPSDLATLLVSVGDGLLNFVFGPADSHTVENVSHWEGIIRTVCQLLSWLPAHSGGEGCTLLGNALQEQLLRLITHIDDRDDAFGNDGTPLNGMVLTVYWFSIESWARFSCSVQKRQPELVFDDAKNLIKYISLLARRLHNYGMQRVLEPILASPNGLDTSLLPERIAELWVCLFHLVSNCHVPTSNDSNLGQHHPFWRIIQLTLQRDDGSPPAGLEASETTWRTIFSICALSQFSVHGMTTSTCRLPASWELVVFALKQIRLIADPDIDGTLPERILNKRDEYIWLIASRCFILCNRWHWRIDDASVMFIQLASIFRSRKYANLRREASDFPSFMLANDLQLLSQYKPSDTAFEIFLKLIVQALNDCHSDNEANTQRIISSKLRKLLALAIPVGSVPFTKSTPPTVHELSMLYNRLSAVAVAIYLESSPASVEKRLTHARRYVDFKDADDTTRVACIRGMMHFAIIMCYRRLPLDDVLSWLAEMTDILVDEYRDIDASANKINGILPSNVFRQRAVFSIQMLLGSVRHIIEAPNIDPAQPQRQYPEPALLNGPWVTRIFANSTNLTHVGQTGLEIRKLVQAFLDARQAAMPVPQRHRTIVAGDQESQEDYGAFDLDLDDPELQAALGDDVETSLAKQNKAKDELVWQVIDSHIAPAIFRLVCKHFNNPSNEVSFEEYCHDADKWIDCWVGCANLLVQLGKRKWEAFLELGPMSWEKIIDASWRRRVGLRFMFMLLRCDPEAYASRSDLFVKVLLESIVAAKVTMENEYMSLVFSIDRLRHPLLRHVPYQPPLEKADYIISVPDFFTLRLPAVDTIFSNLADCLRKEAQGKDNVRQNQTYVGHIVTMLSTMQDVCEQMTEGPDGRTTYLAFCHEVFASLQRHPELMAQQRLAASMTWGQTLEAT